MSISSKEVIRLGTQLTSTNHSIYDNWHYSRRIAEVHPGEYVQEFFWGKLQLFQWQLGNRCQKLQK